MEFSVEFSITKILDSYSPNLKFNRISIFFGGNLCPSCLFWCPVTWTVYTSVLHQTLVSLFWPSLDNGKRKMCLSDTGIAHNNVPNQCPAVFSNFKTQQCGCCGNSSPACCAHLWPSSCLSVSSHFPEELVCVYQPKRDAGTALERPSLTQGAAAKARRKTRKENGGHGKDEDFKTNLQIALHGQHVISFVCECKYWHTVMSTWSLH